MHRLYDWIGIARLILDYANNNDKKSLTVLDLHCGDGKKLSYVKTILKDKRVNIRTEGCVLKEPDEETLDKTYVCKKRAYSYELTESTTPDVIIDMKLSWGMPPVNNKLKLQDGQLYIGNSWGMSAKPAPLIPPDTGDTKLCKMAQKTYGLVVKYSDKKKIGTPYLDNGIHLEMLQHVNSSNRKLLRMLDVGCRDGTSALNCKKFLMDKGIDTRITGIDIEEQKGQERLDEFHQENFYSNKYHNPVDCVVTLSSVVLATDQDRLRLLKRAKSLLKKDGILIYSDARPAKCRRLKKLTSEHMACVLERKHFQEYSNAVKKRDLDSFLDAIQLVETHRRFLDFALLEKPEYKHKLDSKLKERYDFNISEYAMSLIRTTDSFMEGEMLFRCGNVKFENVVKMLIDQGLVDRHYDKIRLNLRQI